jgi:hypothetical protein
MRFCVGSGQVVSNDRGRCPRTPGIWRFGPAAWLKGYGQNTVAIGEPLRRSCVPARPLRALAVDWIFVQGHSPRRTSEDARPARSPESAAECQPHPIQEQGDASAMTASPMPLDCCGARGACQQSPPPSRGQALPSTATTRRLTAAPAVGKWQAECLHHAIGPKRQMPGVWGQSPQEPARVRGQDEPAMTRTGQTPSPRHSREGGNPVRLRTFLDPRLRGGDMWTLVPAGGHE